MKTAFNLCFIVAHVYAFSVKVFLHRGMGRRAFGLAALLVPVLVPLHMTAWAGYDLRPLSVVWYAYLAACVGHGIERGRRRKQGRGNEVHTYYDGEPWLARFLPWCSERTIKDVVEPFGLVGLSLVVGAWNGPLATYLGLGGVCLALTYGLEEDARQQDDDDLHDQLHEARWRAERFRQDTE